MSYDHAMLIGETNHRRFSGANSMRRTASSAISMPVVASQANQSLLALLRSRRMQYAAPTSFAARSASIVSERARTTPPCNQTRGLLHCQNSAIRDARSPETPILHRPSSVEKTYRYARPSSATLRRPIRSSASPSLVFWRLEVPIFFQITSGNSLHQPGDRALLVSGCSHKGVPDFRKSPDADAGVTFNGQFHKSSIALHAPLRYVEAV